MRTMHIHLKIKIASLAAEARIIRRQELAVRNRARYLRAVWKAAQERGEPIDPKQLQNTHWHDTRRVTMYDHRVKDLRPESRSAQVAYGFLRGRAFAAIEDRALSEPDWTRVQQIAERFGEKDHRELRQRLAQWIDEAKAHIAFRQDEAKQIAAEREKAQAA